MTVNETAFCPVPGVRCIAVPLEWIKHKPKSPKDVKDSSNETLLNKSKRLSVESERSLREMFGWFALMRSFRVDLYPDSFL